MRALRTAVFCENIGKVLKNRTLKSGICTLPRTSPAAGMSRKMRCTARRTNTQWWDAGVVERGALEMRCPVHNRTGGSNPSPTAKLRN